MKKKLLIIILTILGAFPVNAQKKVFIGAREKYYLSGNERNMSIGQNIVKDYSKLDPDLEHQVPLNRFILSDDYRLYIGLAIYDTPETIKNYYTISNDDYCLIEQKILHSKKDIFYFLFFKFDGKYNLKIIFRTKRSKLTVVMNYVSDNRQVLKSFFDDKKFLEKKLHIKIVD